MNIFLFISLKPSKLSKFKLFNNAIKIPHPPFCTQIFNIVSNLKFQNNIITMKLYHNTHLHNIICIPLSVCLDLNGTFSRVDGINFVYNNFYNLDTTISTWVGGQENYYPLEIMKSCLQISQNFFKLKRYIILIVGIYLPTNLIKHFFCTTWKQNIQIQ